MIKLELLQYFSNEMRSHAFRFAKTMPKHPHWYTLRKGWAVDDDFINCVQLIREHGYTEYFYKTPFKRLDANGSKYWTMGAPIEDTILINKARLDCVTDYCSFADAYDGQFLDEESKEEDALVISMLGDVSGKRILDIGCGTGLLLDYKKDQIKPEDYVGVDPSKPMSEVFKSKHPEYAQTHVCSRFEDFAWGEFDLIVSTYGSISYVNPMHLFKVKEMLKPNGNYFLMFFADDYDPVSCVKNGIESTHFKKNWEQFETPKEINRFIVCRREAKGRVFPALP